MLTCFVVMSTCWTVRRWREKKNFFFFFILSEVGSVRIPPDIKIYTIGQNIAENGNNTILNDNIPLPNA